MYKKQAHVHFLGIGGIGMSGIATILRYQGYRISGCDLDHDQKSVEDLKKMGCSVYEGNNASQCADPSIDVLVYSSALKTDNPEIRAAQARGIPTISRAHMLAELMRMKYSIAISGAHGKTTTTSMISHILIEAQRDPTVIIGGHLKSISTNARIGKGDFLVAEADESDKSLLRLYPTLAVVTNIDFEHVDVYRDLQDFKDTFKQFLSNLPFYGKAFVCYDDANIRDILPLPHVKTVTYGLRHDADLHARDVTLGSHYSTCTVWNKDHTEPLGSLYLTMPGQHNVLNALAATAVALDLDIPFTTISTALATFRGVDRRFTFRGMYKGVEIFDDYGHHPTEILHALKTARKRAQGKLVVAFQPHRYSRTQGLWQDFLEVFEKSTIDHLVITDIYAASEDAIPTITSERFARELQARNPKFTVSYAPYDSSCRQVQDKVEPVLAEGDLLLLLGAGNINRLAKIINSDSKY